MPCSHIVLNVQNLDVSTAFYLRALEPLPLQLADTVVGDYARLTDSTSFVLVLSQVEERFAAMSYHRRATGLHHLALTVESTDDLDRLERHLRAIGIPLCGQGRTAMDYRGGYDSLFIEDPDRILIEIVHHSGLYFSLDPP